MFYKESLLIMRKNNLLFTIDAKLIVLYFLIIIFGWISLYSSETNENFFHAISFSSQSGKQIIWFAITFFIVFVLQFLDYRFYLNLAFPLYSLSIILLILVLLYGVTVSGSKSWISIFDFRFQPSEFAKFSTALFLSSFLVNRHHYQFLFNNKFFAYFIIFFPFILILIQGDFGTSLIFFSFMIVLYRYKDVSTKFIVLLISFISLFILGIVLNNISLIVIILLVALFSIGISINNYRRIFQIIIIAFSSLIILQGQNFILNNVLKSHQKNRIVSFFNPNVDPLGSSWNVTQSKIAIGSGGLFGKGFLQGSQTRFDFVPRQSTDFIFSVIGEEFGFIGSVLFIFLYSFFLIRLLNLAEIQKDKFSMLYGYSVFSLFFFHYCLNVAMSMGLFPVIGIPLPLVSYGGSSVFSFSILFFVFLRLNSYQSTILRR